MGCQYHTSSPKDEMPSLEEMASDFKPRACQVSYGRSVLWTSQASLHL